MYDFERDKEAYGDEFAGIQEDIAVSGQVTNQVDDTNEQGDDTILGGHANHSL
jgi:hypothetical protein